MDELVALCQANHSADRVLEPPVTLYQDGFLGGRWNMPFGGMEGESHLYDRSL